MLDGVALPQVYANRRRVTSVLLHSLALTVWSCRRRQALPSVVDTRLQPRWSQPASFHVSQYRSCYAFADSLLQSPQTTVLVV